MNETALPANYASDCRKLQIKGIIAALIACSVICTLSLIAAIPALLLLPPLFVLAEVVFFFLYLQKLAIFNLQSSLEPKGYDPVCTFRKFMHNVQQFENVDHYLCLWFKGADIKEIKRGNVEELVSYAFWFKKRQVLAGLASCNSYPLVAASAGDSHSCRRCRWRRKVLTKTTHLMQAKACEGGQWPAAAANGQRGGKSFGRASALRLQSQVEVSQTTN